jgi:hypothetical protein
MCLMPSHKEIEILVRKTGLEPARVAPYHLRVACLPISPYAQLPVIMRKFNRFHGHFTIKNPPSKQ